MNGDLSRVTFNPRKHFTSIVLQQGRVQMDSDANEQAGILLHHLRSMAADLIGQHGGPADDVSTNVDRVTQLRSRRCGFGIIGASSTGTQYDLLPERRSVRRRKESVD